MVVIAGQKSMPAVTMGLLRHELAKFSRFLRLNGNHQVGRGKQTRFFVRRQGKAVLDAKLD